MVMPSPDGEIECPEPYKVLLSLFALSANLSVFIYSSIYDSEPHTADPRLLTQALAALQLLSAVEGIDPS